MVRKLTKLFYGPQSRKLRTVIWLREVTLANKPALRYYGGKHRSANWIMSHFPPHYTYVEPFGGAAGVLLQKEPAYFEVYNDLDSNVVTFFRVLRKRENDLIRAIEYTPWSRDELKLAYELASDELEIARRFYIRCWQSFGHLYGGWRYQHSDNGYSIIEQWNDTKYLHQIADRLKKVQIENDEALKIIDRYDTPRTLFYIDPPYVHDARYRKNGYLHEMTNEQHCHLATKLNGVEGMAIISGYHSELYDNIYRGWHVVEKTTSTNGNVSNTEVLWLSPNVTKPEALPLFQIKAAT